MLKEKSKTIYISDLGYKDPVKEYDLLIWYFRQMANQKPKGHDTKYWLDLMQEYGQRLLELQAFEVYALIRNHATDAKIKRREEWRRKAKEQALKEIEAWRAWSEQHRINHELIKLIRLN